MLAWKVRADRARSSAIFAKWTSLGGRYCCGMNSTESSTGTKRISQDARSGVELASSPTPTVAVIGATGHTARFVAEALGRAKLGQLFVGRDAGRLRTMAEAFPGAELRVAAFEDPAALDAAIQGASAIIHCAGPFLDTAKPVHEAALRVGIHSIDLTAEQGSALDTFERFDASARRAGVAIVPGLAFYGGLGELLATLAVGAWTEDVTVDIAIALDSWHPTAGTRRTGARNTAQRLVLRDGRLVGIESPRRMTRTLPAPFHEQAFVEVPFTETVLVARQLPVRTLNAWLSERALADVRDSATPPPERAEDGRSPQRFLVEVRARSGAQERTLAVSGRDIYATSAELAVAAVTQLLERPPRQGGAYTPGQLFDARALLEALSPGVLTVLTP